MPRIPISRLQEHQADSCKIVPELGSAQQNTPVPGRSAKNAALIWLCAAPVRKFLCMFKLSGSKTTKQIVKKIGVKCPVCGGDIITKRGKNKAFFYSCENYENVDFHPGICPLMKNVRSAVRCCLKRKENLLPYVHNKECGYKVDYEDKTDKDRTEE